MATTFRREYGIQTTINFQLYEYDDAKDLLVSAAHASGDTKVMKDEGAEANTTNGFVDEGQGYSIVLTAAEMTAARVVLYIVDQGTKLWIDEVVIIETFGHASSMFPDNNNAIADAILIRDLDQVEVAAPVHSLASAALKQVSRVVFSDGGNTITVYRTDGTTVKYTQATTQASSVQPIIEQGIAT